MKQLFILGDSVMKGIIYRSGAGMHSYTLCDDGTFGPLTERGISVINRSRMGATVRYCGDRLDRLLPDTSDGRFAVLFEYGGNDSDHDWRAVSECPEGEHRPVTGPEEFVAVYKRNIERAREAGAAVALTNLVPIDPDLYFKHIVRGNSADSILSWLGNVGMLYRFHEYYNGLVERVATESGCPLIDIRSPFLLSHDYRSLISDDGIHPSEKGHRLIRETLAENAGSMFFGLGEGSAIA
ncbi:MAG: SGNH/GDSL hydrolase family protein [Clostridia bacterium]|nr:SGNH/GDSL hydrolase family protein [Clostridia bacterium]